MQSQKYVNISGSVFMQWEMKIVVSDNVLRKRDRRAGHLLLIENEKELTLEPQILMIINRVTREELDNEKRRGNSLFIIR